jgi:hypothetical protein
MQKIIFVVFNINFARPLDPAAQGGRTTLAPPFQTRPSLRHRKHVTSLLNTNQWVSFNEIFAVCPKNVANYLPSSEQTTEFYVLRQVMCYDCVLLTKALVINLRPCAMHLEILYDPCSEILEQKIVTLSVISTRNSEQKSQSHSCLVLQIY